MRSKFFRDYNSKCNSFESKYTKSRSTNPSQGLYWKGTRTKFWFQSQGRSYRGIKARFLMLR